MTLSILSERRVYQPYGLCGGRNGECGKNVLKRVDGRLINLGGKCSVPMEPGVSCIKNCIINIRMIYFDQDTFILLTPGGGGYGKIDDDKQENNNEKNEFQSFIERGSLFDYRLAQEGV